MAGDNVAENWSKIDYFQTWIEQINLSLQWRNGVEEGECGVQAPHLPKVDAMC